LELNVKVGS